MNLNSYDGTYVIKINLNNLNNLNLVLNDLDDNFDDVIIMNKKEYSKLLLEESGTIKYKIKTTEKCSICCDDIKQYHKMYVINTCNHLYHYKCIKKWFQQHANCPICRTSNEQQLEI